MLLDHIIMKKLKRYHEIVHLQSKMYSYVFLYVVEIAGRFFLTLRKFRQESKQSGMNNVNKKQNFT